MRGCRSGSSLDEVRRVDLDAFAHADVPFERLVEVLDPARSQARHPLFQVMLTFQNMAAAELELPGLSVSGVDFDAQIAKFDLQLTLSEGYRARRFAGRFPCGVHVCHRSVRCGDGGGLCGSVRADPRGGGG